MRMNKLLAVLLLALSTLFYPFQAASAAEPSGNITFTLMDVSGRVLGQATVPMSDALGTTLASFFQGIADAVRELIASLPTKESGADEGTASKDVWISSKVKVGVSATGYGSGAGGGGGGLTSPE